MARQGSNSDSGCLLVVFLVIGYVYPPLLGLLILLFLLHLMARAFR